MLFYHFNLVFSMWYICRDVNVFCYMLFYCMYLYVEKKGQCALLQTDTYIYMYINIYVCVCV